MFGSFQSLLNQQDDFIEITNNNKQQLLEKQEQQQQTIIITPKTPRTPRTPTTPRDNNNNFNNNNTNNKLLNRTPSLPFMISNNSTIGNNSPTTLTDNNNSLITNSITKESLNNNNIKKEEKDENNKCYQYLLQNVNEFNKKIQEIISYCLQQEIEEEKKLQQYESLQQFLQQGLQNSLQNNTLQNSSLQNSLQQDDLNEKKQIIVNKQINYKYYRPITFNKLKNIIYKINNLDLKNNLCNFELKLNLSKGKSDSIFGYSYNNKYLIKTLNRNECIYTRNVILPKLFIYLNDLNNKSLLIDIYGLFKLYLEKYEIRFMIMNNLFYFENNLKNNLKNNNFKNNFTESNNLKINNNLNGNNKINNLINKLNNEVIINKRTSLKIENNITNNGNINNNNKMNDLINKLNKELSFNNPKIINPKMETTKSIDYNNNNKIKVIYDIKGSTVGRKSLPNEYIQKDLNIIENNIKFKIGTENKNKLLQQLQNDCNFLQSLDVMDYSLLIGVLELNNQLDNLNNFQCKYYFPDIENNKIIYLFGIVDYLQEYNMKKKSSKKY
ncbi:hypothetical protein ABK040_004160 [Willaertia magna]